MKKNIVYVYVAILVVVLAAVWFLLDAMQNSNRVEQLDASPVPSINSSSDSASLEQELDASIQMDVDSEFKAIDSDIEKL